MKLGSKNKKYVSYTEEKKKNKSLKYLLVGIVTASITASVYQFVIVDYYCEKTKETTIKQLTNSDSEYVQAFVLNKNLDKGAPITVQDFTVTTRSIDIVPGTYVTDVSQLEGMVAKIPLSEKSIVTSDMFVKMEEEITDTIKNQDYSWITVHSFLKLDDYIDIHYKELDGTDTIVVAKKKVINLNGKVFAIDISEEERAYINNATVKTAISGGELYTSIYPDPENQNAAKVTYKLDKEIEEKIKNNPNIVNQSVDKIKENTGDSNTTQKNDDVNANINTSSEKVTVSKPEFIGGEE